MTERERNLIRRYTLTLDGYDELLRGQGGRCAICFEKPRGDENLCVDHDHETGRIRGLLCHSCNRGIGLLGDNVPRLRAAVSYLTGYAAKFAVYSDCE